MFYGIVNPKHEMWGAPRCGYDCDRVLVAVSGGKFTLKKPRWWFLHPTLPRVSDRRLRKLRVPRTRHRVRLKDRRAFLEEKLKAATPVIIWARRKPSSFCIGHPMVVVGCDTEFDEDPGGRNYYVVDPRRGVHCSRDPVVPTGTVMYTEESLFAHWRNFPWSKRVSAIALG